MTEQLHDLTAPSGAPDEPACRRRSGGRGWAAATFAGVLAAGGATAAVLTLGGGTAEVTAADSAPASAVTPPPGFRFVGLGHAAIAVPEGWGVNEMRCGTPVQDTVVLWGGSVANCLQPRPKEVESVTILPGDRRSDFTVDREVMIDGVPAQRDDTACLEPFEDVTVCTSAVYVPSERVTFRAESSTGRVQVEQIMSRIRIVPGRVGVPDWASIANEEQQRSGEVYAQALRDAGLEPEVRTERRRGVDPGFLLDVKPVPGTMLRSGDTVALTVTAEPDAPADELRVSINADGHSGSSLSDEEFRKGAMMELDVGDRIWAYAEGTRAETLAHGLTGDALTPAAWSEDASPGFAWSAERPGRSTLTLSITAAGERIELGTVTVLVR